MRFSLLVTGFLFSFVSQSLNALPTAFDLRSIDGKSLVSSIKHQSGGTCWTHATMAALEGNLLMTHQWQQQGESGEPDLAEYHLDWWNGFNSHYNADISPASGGLTVHQGGDYRVAEAYLSRGGAVRDIDGQSFNHAPKLSDPSYHTYYVRDIEWFTAGSNNEQIDQIKNALMRNGVMGTALHWNDDYYNSSNNTFYQPPTAEELPNHAVALVGWDDNKVTDAPQKGAWIAKNSWGTNWGENGYFWISYYDKTTGHHPQMGAVSFKNVERLAYDKIYSWDYHGWRDTMPGVSEVFNAFQSEGGRTGKELLKSVSFITSTDLVSYIVTVYKSFENGQLGNMVSMAEGGFDHTGFHTINLDTPVELKKGENFYIQLNLSHGGHAYDKTSDVPVLLGGGTRTIVESRANPGESFYKENGTWVDLTQFNKSANFCIKALTTY
jgi:C1A family cysteine protease